MISEYREEKREEVSEAEEIKEILEAVTPFLEKLKDMAKELINIITTSMDGEKLGKDIANLYKELKEAGLPDEMINEMIRDFYRKKLESMPTISELVKSFVGTFMMKEKKKEEEEIREEKKE